MQPRTPNPKPQNNPSQQLYSMQLVMDISSTSSASSSTPIPMPQPVSVLLPCYTAPGQIKYYPFVITPVPTQQPTLNPNTERNREKRKKQKALKQAKKFAQKQKQLQSKDYIQETLSEKIAKSEAYNNFNRKTEIVSLSHGHFASSMLFPIYAQNNYSQNAVLAKVDAFLRMNKCKSLSPGGHCNGITVLWLTMMSWNAEALFYQ